MKASIRIPEIRFTRRTLANGLDVIARRQGDLPIVAVNLWYHVGSKNEAARQRGFAHLFEHLMFEGSEHYPHDFFKPLQRLGASVNGSTSTDRTNYFVDLPIAHLELALAMESDRMGYFLPVLTPEKLRIQKDVVKNEYRQNYANRPYGQVSRLMAEALFPPGHPYSWTTIGLMEDVEAADLDDVESFFRRFYVPSNASLCLVGDIDEEKAIEQAERYFGPIPGGAPALRPVCPETRLDTDAFVTFHDKVELEKFYFAWHTVAHFQPDDQALDTLSDVLSRGKASRLYRKLVIESQLLQDVSAYQSGRELAGTFGVYGTLRPGRSIEEVREVIDQELVDLAENGPREEELDRIRTALAANFIYSLDNVGGFGGVADRLNAYNTYLGDPGRIKSDLEEALSVTADQVRSVAKKYVTEQPRLTLLATGKKPKTTLAPLDRSTPPPPSAAVAYLTPIPKITNLRCGIPLWVLPRKDLPMVAATIVLPAGAAAHSPSQGGLANLASAMLDEGTTTRTTHEIANQAESIGTHLSTGCGWDGAYINLQCLSSAIGESFELAVDVLRNASFPEGEFSRIKAQSLAALKAERDRAEPRAGRAFLQAIYGSQHPFGIPIDGTEESVARLSRSDLVQFFQEQHSPSGSACVVAGDVDQDVIVPLLDRLLEGWAPTPNRTPSVPPTPASTRTRLILLDRPGATQAVVRMGHAGARRLDPDHSDLIIFNHILGGQFTSRLNAKLREEKGFTYGIRSHFDFRREAGPFVISASLQSDRLAEALLDLKHEVGTLLDVRPPSVAEIDDAKRSLIEGQARQFETPSSLVARFAGLILHDLPPDYHRHFAERIGAVTPTSALEAARRKIRPEELITVIVADASQVEASLRRLEWGEFTVLDDLTTSLG